MDNELLFSHGPHFNIFYYTRSMNIWSEGMGSWGYPIVNVSDYTSPEACGAAAVQIWRDPQKMQPYLDAPITLNSKVDDYLAVYKEYRPWQKPFVDMMRSAYPDLN